MKCLHADAFICSALKKRETKSDAINYCIQNVTIVSIVFLPCSTYKKADLLTSSRLPLNLLTIHDT